MSRTTTVRVTAIIEDWSMIYVHALREDRRASALKDGEALLAFNVKRTMARLVDAAGGIHTYWADEGEIFDIETLSSYLEQGFFVKLGMKGKKATPLKIAA